MVLLTYSNEFQHFLSFHTRHRKLALGNFMGLAWVCVRGWGWKGLKYPGERGQGCSNSQIHIFLADFISGKFCIKTVYVVSLKSQPKKRLFHIYHKPYLPPNPTTNKLTHANTIPEVWDRKRWDVFFFFSNRNLNNSIDDRFLNSFLLHSSDEWHSGYPTSIT